MTVLEDRLRLERKKVKAQGEIIWKTRRRLRRLAFNLKTRMAALHPESVGFERTKETKENVEKILAEMEKDYFDFKASLRESKPKRKLEHFK